MKASAHLLMALGIVLPAWGAQEAPAGMALVPASTYKPSYALAAKTKDVPAFFMDLTQVTNAQFLEFVREHPEWQRSHVTPKQADANYLRHWAGDLDLGPDADRLKNAPVTHVSWHAAQAYCEANGKRLPTQDEWESAARADATRVDASNDPAFLRQLLEWYSTPAGQAAVPVQSAPANVHGLRGLHGVVWEWVSDFNSTLIVGDSRGDGTLERKLFCGAGSLLAADVNNYASFMRYAFRSSLKGDYCVASLGFRCAKSVGGQEPAPAKPSIITSLYDLPGEWRDQDNHAVSLSHLKGKLRVLTMGFTSCKFACPRILGDMQRIESALGSDASLVGFVFLSIDPQNDIPAQLTKTMVDRKMNADHWTLLTAPEALVQRAAVSLDFKYQVVDGFFAHSNLIAVLDEQGNIVHRVESLDADITPTINFLRSRLAKR